ncbi:protein adenylyltransferase SelO [Candidatus Nitrotoga sp. HW29]|uniref:protein adenylyltransferase SelO n=1 Tax=Candidatus Nitrotoga sp. HW29 TaxID=2886963 RepID=UPI001EF24FA1|nr:YdiU family protein [Candidatus Nitrotoga sp. HW29]
MKKLEQLNFDNTFSRLPDVFHSRLNPTPLPNAYLVSFNASAAKLINLDVTEVERADFVEYFIGNRLLPGSEPLSMLYAGHQFGHFVPQLGDGRAILLGEIKNNDGEYWDIQLKGAGITPFSRNGDGRAVLRSSIREYLCSEAMHGLGIPTSRALCIVGSDAEVYRETIESAAVVTRLSPSHVRFGSFEVFAYRGQHEPIAMLADYVIAKHFPDISDTPDKYLRLLNEVITRTASLMAQWQAVGFAHGVMNTDNMSILGLTFDYGPFGFMETYDPGFICNHSDHGGRYAFDQQPQIGLWNLACLAQALTPIIAVEEAQAALENYEPTYFKYYTELMGKKLGLTNASKEDAALVKSLLEMMRANQLDYTNLFRSLGSFKFAPDETNNALRDQFIDRAVFDAWAGVYRTRLQSEPETDEERKVRMDKVNPKYILRNSMAQSAIALAERERDFSEVDRLLALLSRPFDEQPEMEDYAAPAPDWARHVVVSCSS